MSVQESGPFRNPEQCEKMNANILASLRCQDVHSDRWGEPDGDEPCHACMSWGKYAAAAATPHAAWQCRPETCGGIDYDPCAAAMREVSHD